MTKKELKELANKLPTDSGVYLMHSASGEVIYVGKAKNLKRRVSQYFDNREKQIKVSKMVENVDHFETMITKSESDAFALECNLIKKYKPKYNILLKDDKNFPYLVIDKREEFPRFSVTRKVKNDGRTYFGPFVTYMRISSMLDIINSAFCLPTCHRNLQKASKRQCIEGDMGRCTMPCVRAVAKADYQAQLEGAYEFLSGKTQNIKRIIKNRMNELAEKEDFENALVLRDNLALIEKAEEKVFTNIPLAIDADIFAIVGATEKAAIVQFLRGGKLVGQQILNLTDKEGTEAELLLSVLGQFYVAGEEIPNTILVSHDVASLATEFFEKTFQKRVGVLCPARGTKRKLVENAEFMAQKYIAKNRVQLAQYKKNTEGALDDLAEVLGLDARPWRIECYDISNTFGTNSVASMVVFEGGLANKKQYRKFKIKTVEGANDFASMKEVLSRRFLETEEFGARPDLLVMDGGLGQLHAVKQILDEMKIDIPLISLAKKEELIFTSKSNQPIALLKNEPALKLLQRLRDEAHRFAINYHRQVRNKKMFE